MVRAYRRKTGMSVAEQIAIARKAAQFNIGNSKWYYGGYSFGTTWYTKQYGGGYEGVKSSSYVSGAPEKTTYSWSLSKDGRQLAQGKVRRTSDALVRLDKAVDAAYMREVLESVK